MNNTMTLHDLGVGIANISDVLASESELTTKGREQLIAALRKSEAQQLAMIDTCIELIKANTNNLVDAIMDEFTARADALNGVIEPQLQAAE